MQHTDSENSASAIVTSCHLVDFGGKHGQSSSAGKDTFSMSDNKIVVPSGYD
jgi:hypothetical protein